MKVTLSTLGTLGDVLPFARLARHLVERGHRVTLHSWRMHGDCCAVPGARFVPSAAEVTAPQLAAALGEALRAATPVGQCCRLARFLYGEQTAAYYQGVCEALANADLAVLNVLDHVSQAAADALGVPWVGWRTSPPAAGATAAADDAALAALDDEVSTHIQRVAGGRRIRVRLFRQRSEVLDLVAASPALLALDQPPERGAPVRVTGHWLPPPVHAALPPHVEAFLAGNTSPVILATFGTIPDVLDRARTVLAACQRLNLRVILQDVTGSATSLPGSRSPAVCVLTDRVSYAPLLARVDGVLHHGGVGITHEVCRAGRPSLCVPHFPDQHFWGRLLAGRGLGPVPLPYDQLAVGALEERIDRLLHEAGYAARAAEVSGGLSLEDGVARSAALIESL